MCELMTIAAALVFSALWLAAKRSGRRAGALGSAALVFWGAALMWGVDCTKSLIDGEGFFDLSAGDARLGALVVAAGLIIYAAFAIAERRHAAAQD